MKELILLRDMNAAHYLSKYLFSGYSTGRLVTHPGRRYKVSGSQ